MVEATTHDYRFFLWKIVIIAPFVIALYYLGNGWLGNGIGWLSFFLTSGILYYFFEYEKGK